MFEPPPPLPPVNMKRVSARAMVMKEQHIRFLEQDCKVRVTLAELSAASSLVVANERVTIANERADRAENKCAKLRVTLDKETQWKRDVCPLVAGLWHVTRHTHKHCVPKTRGKACVDAIVNGAFDDTGRGVVRSLGNTSHGNLARFDIEKMLDFQSPPFC